MSILLLGGKPLVCTMAGGSRAAPLLCLLLPLGAPAAVGTPSGGSVSVCTSKTCRRDGSPATLRRFQQLAAEVGGFEAVECGCLGQCGKGPNVAALAMGAAEPRRFGNVRKAATIAAVVEIAFDVEVPEPLVELQACASRARRLASMDRLGEAREAYEEGLRGAAGYGVMRAELESGLEEVRGRMAPS